MNGIVEQVVNFADSGFKYILILFNFMTLIVVYVHKNRQRIPKQHHILFVTAHPDDQVMFFRPSLASITSDYFVHLLCLSGGQSRREQQLKASAQRLKLHKLKCIKSQLLIDSMDCAWHKQLIQQIVLEYVGQNDIKAIFTFDEFGVSGHQNHKSIYQALKQKHYPKEELQKLNKKQESLTEEQIKEIQLIKHQSIKIYHLKSVNVARKYTIFLQIIFALLRDFSWVNLNVFDAYKSMAIHESQFTWYRKLWVFFSQFSYINVFTRTRIKINPPKIQESLNQEEEQVKNVEFRTEQAKKQK